MSPRRTKSALRELSPSKFDQEFHENIGQTLARLTRVGSQATIAPLLSEAIRDLSILRSIIERASRQIVFRRRLPAAFGRRPFFVTPDAALAYLKPGYAGFSDLIEVASTCVNEGDCVWDIGGNVGLFSFLAAHKVGPGGTVVCFEPDPFLASMVQRSTRLAANHDRNINVLCAAVSDSTGIAQFSIAERGRASNSLQQSQARSQAGGIRYTQFVPTTTLDAMLSVFAPPTFIKIDVEGVEHLVLEGARMLLEQCRPQLYIEVGGRQSAAVTAVLKSFNYEMFDGSQPLASQQPGSKCAFNTLAVPAERLSIIRAFAA